MPKQIIRDVFGELLETGRQTAKTGKKAAADVAQQTVRTLAGHKPQSADALTGIGKGEKKSSIQKSEEEKEQSERIEQMAKLDRRRSKQAYEEIQQQIQLYRRKLAEQPRKYVTAQAGFDEEQVKDPESFWDKIKKKKEKAKKKLPWSSKKGMGTGEIRRGVSG
jgi:leucyl aminopeptidase